MTDADLASTFLQDVRRAYRMYKALGESAIAQVPSDSDLHRAIDPHSNSIAIIVKHVAGNLRSRFRDFLTTDGEKPDRNRDDEFEMPTEAVRSEVMRWWNEGWDVALSSIDALHPEDLLRTVYIRGEAFQVTEALDRSVTHTAYHVGQIVYLARHLAWPNWKSLSIPKGKSAEVGKGTFKQGPPPGSPPRQPANT
jgi:hypothetical protein